MRHSLFAVLFLITTVANAATTVPDDANDVQPLQVGDAAPAFSARNPDGSDFEFDAENSTDRTMLIFYRGGWCPYCNMHLQELRNVVPELSEQGVEVKPMMFWRLPHRQIKV